MVQMMAKLQSTQLLTVDNWNTQLTVVQPSFLPIYSLI